MACHPTLAAPGATAIMSLGEGPTVRVRGASLVGIATAARLARWGHQVEVVGTPSPERCDPPVMTLPAVWRDLFTKTGQPLAGALNGAHLELVEAPPAMHHFFDGSEVALPTERGAQVRALEPLVGRTQALAWAQVLDRADTLWQAWRRQGAEHPFDTDADLGPLLPRTSMGELTAPLTDARLVELFTSVAARAGAENEPATRDNRAPALLASRWSVERTFGRWHLIDADTRRAQPLSRLTDLLMTRALSLGVRFTHVHEQHPGSARVDVDTLTPVPPRSLLPWRSAPRPWAPSFECSHHDNDLPPGVVTEHVHHRTEAGAEVTWLWQGHAVVTDWATRQAPPPGTAGWTVKSFRQWRERPPLRVDDTHWRGSAASHAGNEPWAQLLTGALLAYEVHEHLTGEDIRPTNRNQPLPPRLRPIPVPRPADGSNTQFGRAPE